MSFLADHSQRLIEFNRWSFGNWTFDFIWFAKFYYDFYYEFFFIFDYQTQSKEWCLVRLDCRTVKFVMLGSLTFISLPAGSIAWLNVNNSCILIIINLRLEMVKICISGFIKTGSNKLKLSWLAFSLQKLSPMWMVLKVMGNVRCFSTLLFYLSLVFSVQLSFLSFIFTTDLHIKQKKKGALQGALIDWPISSCKVSREYFSLWMFPVCTNKTTRDKSLHYKWNMTKSVSRNWHMTRVSVTLLSKTISRVNN